MLKVTPPRVEAKATACPLTGLFSASRSVRVSVLAATPSATMVAGAAASMVRIFLKHLSKILTMNPEILRKHSSRK
ncbi:hypothetical protein EEI76_11190 [Enterobacter cloacae]|nr:hypothetical protein EEI76_11190 [Enterobacter cloacae]